MSNAQWYFAFQASNWAKAVIFQGNRAIETMKRAVLLTNQMYNSRDDADVEQRLSNEINENSYRQRMEEYFFALVLGKSVDFLRRLSEFSSIVSVIDQRIGLQNIMDIRNMREHDDDYIGGEGYNAKERLIGKEKLLGGVDEEGSSMVDGTATMIYVTEDKYLLGNIIDIFEVVRVFKDEIKNIEKIKNELLFGLRS